MVSQCQYISLTWTLYTTPARQRHRDLTVFALRHWFPFLLEPRDGSTRRVEHRSNPGLGESYVSIENDARDLECSMAWQVRLIEVPVPGVRAFRVRTKTYNLPDVAVHADNPRACRDNITTDTRVRA